MKRSILFLLLILSLLIASCATIEITERDAFDAHRTITPETFNFEEYSLHNVSLGTEDGVELDGWFLERNNAQATVVYFGGNSFLMVTSRSLIEAYRDIPVNIMMIDYRGYGRSTGTSTVRGLQTDARVAYNYALSGSPSPQ
jgi:uncharacterized protein